MEMIEGQVHLVCDDGAVSTSKAISISDSDQVFISVDFTPVE